MKKLNNKGFTLIEIVIVIVIIAILAAMLVPSLTQWIDKSKMKTFTSACGTIKTAASSAVANAYAETGVKAFNADTMLNDVSADVGKTVVFNQTPASGQYAIMSYDYANDTITIQDPTFTGTSTNGGSWKVEKVNK